MGLKRFGGPRHGRGAALLATALVFTAPAAAQAADITVDAAYSASLGGWTIGSGTLGFSLADRQSYDATITAQVSGIASLVSNRSARGNASGRVGYPANSARTYGLSVYGASIPNVVEVSFSGGSVRQINATELRFASNNDRVPLLPQHKQGVVDPLGGFIIQAKDARDPFAQSNCNRTIKVFDGRVRYDLRLTYGATTEITGETSSGYTGPALICAVAYRPIAGQRVLSAEQQKFERDLEFSIWFVPLGASGVMVPHRVVIGTPMGLLTVHATRFQISGEEPLEARNSKPIVRRKKVATEDSTASTQ